MASLFLQHFHHFMVAAIAVMMGMSSFTIPEGIPIAELLRWEGQYDQESAKEKGVIIDLDGTLADNQHRLYHIKKDIKDKSAYHSLLGEDEANHWCFELLEAMRARGYKIILITGRPDEYRKETVAWLRKKNIGYDELYMNTDERGVPDHLFKKSVYENFIRGRIDIAFVVEDRTRVVDMWRQLGLVCLQCELGDF